MTISIELIYFAGCPHAAAARANLRDALFATGLPARWREWAQDDTSAPAYVGHYGSPTILVNGRDVTGAGVPAAARACAAVGAPARDGIRRALEAASGPPRHD